MQRKIEAQLVEWKDSPHRKPLLLRGARQTGKTWLIEDFGERYFRDTIKIDFMHDEQARGLFEGDLDPKRIIREIELIYGRGINPETTLLAFDEIQEAPRGLTSLKYFCEQAHEYHVIAAGSYIGIAMRRQGESFPVGKVDQLVLHPMDFEEYVRARAGAPLADALAEADMDMLAKVQNRLVPLLKEYLVVGGMPEAVEFFSEEKDFRAVRSVQNGILEGYNDDFAKHAPGRILERMHLAWKSLPGQLAHENKRFVYGSVRPGGRARDFEEALQWLSDYGVVTKVPRVEALRFSPLSYEDLSSFKLFCIDTGLLCALSGLDPSVVLEGPRLFTEFKGALTEQYVAQQLVAQGFDPVYWSSSTGTAEVDFALSQGATIVPIEVKAAENLRSKSLKAACQKFQLERAVRTSLSPYRDEGWLVNVPLWEIDEIARFI
ncbi:MAG: ATP-binding protein [Coriobacteriaceae bacterium]|nr:MAG: ATP-binding protein [Coriobacteriaceae bacterium]